MALTTGVILGYLFLSINDSNRYSPSSNADFIQGNPAIDESFLSSQSTHQVIYQEDQATIDKGFIGDNEINNGTRLQSLEQQINLQQKQIALLQAKLYEQQKINEGLLATQKNVPEELQTISIEGFEKRLGNHYLDRFKGIAIELKHEQLEKIRKEFETENDKADWSAEYENNINDFVHNGDPQGLHFVDELSCNHKICRVKVQSDDAKGWKKLFLSMTQQDWYKSMTLTENSGDPNIFIYYIPKPMDTSPRHKK